MSRLLLKTLLLSNALLFVSLPLTTHADLAVGEKIKNASEGEVQQALQETLKATQAALTALRQGADAAIVQEHISNARQIVKRVEINRLDVIRTRASEKLKNARHTLTRGERAQAEDALSQALTSFQEMERLFKAGI